MSGKIPARYSARTVEINNFSAEWRSDVVFFNFDIIVTDGPVHILLYGDAAFPTSIMHTALISLRGEQ